MARIEAKCADRNDRQTNRPIGGCLLRPFHVHPARIATKKDISLRRFDHKTGPERPIAVSPPTAPPVVIAGNDDTNARPHVHALTPIQRDRLRACLRDNAVITKTRRSAGGPAPIIFSAWAGRSEEHTSELQSLMRISYAVFCL